MFGGQLLNALMGTGASQMGAPMAPMQGDPLTVPMGGAEEAITIEGFKPTKRNILGRLADMWLQAQGQKPIYEGRMQERDMKRAFEGFTSDPKSVAARLAQLGRPDLAMQLWDKVADNERADGTQTRLNAIADLKREETVIDRIVNVLGTAKPENYAAVRQRMQAYADANGVKLPYDLPETYDIDAIEGLRMGEMPVHKQLDYALRQERVAQQGRATDSLIEHRDESRVIRQDRNAVLEQQGERRLDQADTRIARTPDKGPKYVTTKYGRGIMSPDGNAFGQLINGKKHTYVKTFKPDGSYFWKLAKVED